MERGFFRDEAVRQLAAAERLDERLRLVRPREWLAFAAVALLGLGALGWAVFGRIETTLDADGVVLHRSESAEPTAPPFLAIAYIGPGDWRRVEPGMRVKVWPASTREVDGYVEGVVAAVASSPSSRSGLVSTLPSEEQVERILAETDGSPFEVRVALNQDAASPQGVAWSTGDGPAGALTNGLPARVEIVVANERPIELVVPDAR